MSQSPSTPSSSSTTSGESSNKRWTTNDLLGWMRQHFESHGIDSPRVVAELLLAHVLGCERLRLYMEPQRPATAEELKHLRELVVRASNREPVQYLTGLVSFFSRDFLIDRSTQIPQPCTEVIVEQALAWRRERLGIVDQEIEDQSRYSIAGFHPVDDPEMRAEFEQQTDERSQEPAFDSKAEEPSTVHSPLRIVDIGTGSGCLAVTLALQIPEATVVATDIADDALDLARRNAERFRVTNRIVFRSGALWEPLERDGESDLFDVIVSNPPYIPDSEWENQMDQSVKQYTPQRALRGGADGLDVIRPLIAEAPSHLNPGGLLAVEIAHSQAQAMTQLAEQTGALTDITIRKDEDGLSRVLTAIRAS